METTIKNNRRRRGVAILEVALTLPILLLLTFGLIEYGWLFLNNMRMSDAARQGARTAILPSGTNALALAAITNQMQLAGLGSSGYTVTFSPSDVSTPAPGVAVTVAISLPYANIGIVGIPLVPVPTTLNASVSMAKEGP
jgi:Flp pilus assembly protein TadG